MFARTFSLLLAQVLASPDLRTVVAHQETELARAINAKDKAALLLLTGDDFHESIGYGSALHYVTTDIEREVWATQMSSGDVVRYGIESSKIRSAGPGAYYAEATGTLTLRSVEGSYTQKRFTGVDMWVSRSNSLKLVSRVSHVM